MQREMPSPQSGPKEATPQGILGYFQRPKHSTEKNSGDTLVLFIHGLSGNPSGTWGQMLRVFNSDPELSTYSFGCYSYPSKILRLPLTKRMAGIGQLADGLKTLLANRYANKKKIILVGHSLGGLIIRQHILEQIKNNSLNRIQGAIFFASPHTGADLANVGSALSWRHRHLKQLCSGSDTLTSINKDWVLLNAESRIKTSYVVGGADAVVSPESAAPYAGAQNVETLIECDHTSIIKPINTNDDRFIVLKNFIQSLESATHTTQNTKNGKTGDVLFYSYTPESEAYYIKREIDETLKNLSRRVHVWAEGPSGVGKTAALTRLASRENWKLQHILLDGNRDKSAIELFKIISCILADRANLSRIQNEETTGEIIESLRRAIEKLSTSAPIAILIEEIPFKSNQDFSDFMELVLSAAQLSDTLPNNKVTWLFSSISDPRPHAPKKNQKFWEKINIVSFEKWDDISIEKLCRLIKDELQLKIEDSEISAIALRSHGNPRFIKQVIGRHISSPPPQKPIAEIISSVEMDFS